MRCLYLSLAAILLMLSHIACSTDKSDDVVVNGDVVEMTIIAEQSRTHLNDNATNVEWDVSGEYLMVYQTADVSTISNMSNEAVVVNDLAQFSVSFMRIAEANSFTYNALYPAASIAADATPSVDDVVVMLPTVQRPSADSFDGDADLLVARQTKTVVQPESLSMAFKRLVAIGCMSFAGVDEIMISSVEFRIPNAHLVGSFSVNLPDGRIAEYSTTSDCITIAYDTPVVASTPIYFTLLPIELGAGDSFGVSIVDTNGNTISRDITLADGRSLNFTAGNMTIFKVNMEDRGSESADFAAIAGEWHLTEWCGMSDSNLDFDIYLDIDTNGNIALWQRLSHYGWERFDSTATLVNGVIEGIYSDGVKWGSAYNISVKGNQMIWTNTLDATDVSIYERTEIPSSVEECVIASKFSTPLL